MIVERKVSFFEVLAARRSFPAGKEGKEDFRNALHHRSPKEIAELKSKFGTGEYGKRVFREVVVFEPQPCEYRKDGQECNTPANGTIDFDACGETDFKLVCSNHQVQWYREMTEENRQKGRIAVNSINGNGRP